MSTYRLMDGASGRPGVGSTGTQPPAAVTPYSGDYIAGLLFEVTSGNLWFEGYWWWVPPTGGLTAPQKCALWCVTGVTNSSAVLVPNSVVTSGTLTSGWNFIALANPLQLSPFTTYVAATGVNGAFPDTQHQFGAGNPYSAGITNGPLVAFSDMGGTNTEPYGQHQGPFTVGGTDPSVTVPLIGNLSDILWLDVSVSDQAPPGYNGTYRIWPNKFDANHTLLNDAAQTFILSTEIRYSQPVTSSFLWFFSAPGATSLPTWAGVWRISDQSLVVANTSPAWLTPSGGASPAAGSGWIKCAMNKALPADNYKASIYNANGANGTWNCTTYAYWLNLAANGIVQGPVFAPGQTTGSNAYIYFNNAGATPPYTDGSSQEHSQGTWYPVGPTYPLVAVDYTFPGTSNPPGAIAENFWVDLEVKPSVTGSAALSASATLTAAGTRGVAATAPMSAPGILTAAGRHIAVASTHLAAGPALSAAATRSAVAHAALAAPGHLSATGAVAAFPSSASLSAFPSLTAIAFLGADPDQLWRDYQAAEQEASDAWLRWGILLQAGGVSWSGNLYSQAYALQTVAEAARQAWLAANEAANPGVRG